MPKVQTYISEELAQQINEKGIHATKVCQEALEAAVADPGSPKAKLVQLKKTVRELEAIVNG